MDAFRGGAQELTDDGILGQNPVMEGSTKANGTMLIP